MEAIDNLVQRSGGLVSYTSFSSHTGYPQQNRCMCALVIAVLSYDGLNMRNLRHGLSASSTRDTITNVWD